MTKSGVGAGPPIPRYQSHKVVEALRIVGFERADDDVVLILEDARFGRPVMTSAWWEAKNPNEDSDGYWVRYDDGYESWSPVAAFENGYTRITDDG